MKVLEVNHSQRRVGALSRPAGAGAAAAASRGALSQVTTLAAMWQRIPGDVAARIRDVDPQNFAILELPPLSVLRASRVPPKTVGARDHPFAKWRTVALDSAARTAQALLQIERENAANPRAIKFKLNFVNGLQIVLTRTEPTDPDSLVCTGRYEPSGSFLAQTAPQASVSRRALQRKLAFVADDRGRITRPASAGPAVSHARTASPFAPEQLYADCPPPEPSPVTFDFTPMSSIAFLQRPNTTIRGCRPGLNQTNPSAVHFRPRTFNLAPREQLRNRYAMERLERLAGRQTPIDGRNALSPMRAGGRSGSGGGSGGSAEAVPA